MNCFCRDAHCRTVRYCAVFQGTFHVLWPEDLCRGVTQRGGVELA